MQKTSSTGKKRDIRSSWIPMRINLREDPRVLHICALCGIAHTTAIGCLHAVWSWFYQYMDEAGIVRLSDLVPGGSQLTLSAKTCNAHVTFSAHIDALTCTPGFADAMQSAGWLTFGKHSVAIPHPDKHLSQAAQRREVTAKRVSEWREKVRNASVTPNTLPPNLTLPNLRREEEEAPPATAKAQPTEPGPAPMTPYHDSRCPHDSADGNGDTDAAYLAAVELLGKRSTANLSAKERGLVEELISAMGSERAAAEIREAKAAGMDWMGLRSYLWKKRDLQAKRAAKAADLPTMSAESKRLLGIEDL